MAYAHQQPGQYQHLSGMDAGLAMETDGLLPWNPEKLCTIMFLIILMVITILVIGIVIAFRLPLTYEIQRRFYRIGVNFYIYSLYIARIESGLPKAHAEKLEPWDLQTINDVGGTHNCYYLCLAAMLNKPLKELINETEIMVEANGAPSVEYILLLYKLAGLKSVSYIFKDGLFEFMDYLRDNIQDDGMVRFLTAYELHDGIRHVLHTRAWKTANEMRLLFTDFQQPLLGSRFSITLPANVVKLHILFDPEFNSCVSR